MKPMPVIMALSIFCAWLLQSCGGNKGYQVIVEFPAPVADSKVAVQTLWIYSIIPEADEVTCDNLISGVYKIGNGGDQEEYNESIPYPFTKKVSQIKIAKKDAKTRLIFVEGEDYNNQPILRGCTEVNPGGSHDVTVTLGMVCPAGWGDCDGNFSTGCEADFTSPSVCNGHAVSCSFLNGAISCVCSADYTGARCDQCAAGSSGTYPNCNKCDNGYLGIFPNCFLPSSLDYCLTSQCFPVPPTGQTTCYSYSTNWTPVSCSSLGTPCVGNFCGQDAQYAKTRTFTCSVGPCNSGSASVDDVITDSVTGLMWQRTFGSDLAWMDNTTTPPSYPAAEYCASLNTTKYGGLDGWRLPNPVELNSIIDHSKTAPKIDTDAFPLTPNGETKSNLFWTSSELVGNSSCTSCAWAVRFIEGYSIVTCYENDDAHYTEKSNEHYVRCVRGGPIPKETGNTDRFNSSVGPDPVVTDLVTGLMWLGNFQMAGGPCTWEMALKNCESLDYGGHQDWRLPNINELVSLANYDGQIPTSEFPGMTTDTFWSSTSKPDDGFKNAWELDFGSGLVDDDSKDTNYQVLCVRLGP